MWSALKSKIGNSTALVDRAFTQAVKNTGAIVDSETAQSIKAKARSAVATASSISKNLVDVNGDGKIDAEDIKLAAEKAGVVWSKIDPDLKTALIAGGVAGAGVNFIPFVGQIVAFPAFVGTTAYFFLVAKLSKLKSAQSPAERISADEASQPSSGASNEDQSN